MNTLFKEDVYKRQHKSKIILFIDEIHTLIGKGESMDLANMLKAGLDLSLIHI